MDPVLPFRVLSPGTRKPKFNNRFKDSKLSLKSRKGTHIDHESKENTNPMHTAGKNVKKCSLRFENSDLMTSDESDNSLDPYRQPSSVLSINTQESTFALPVAESTRCEPPLRQLSCESTMASLHTASNGINSSGSTEYFTAYPLPVGCDESIICISDSSPEPDKKVVTSKYRLSQSVLISSDESDSEPSCGLQQFMTTKKKINETVHLESSTSDADYLDDEDVVVPPSEKSDSCSVKSSGSSDIVRTDADNYLIIPPSPDKYSQSDIVSNDSFCGQVLLEESAARQLGDHSGNLNIKRSSCDTKASHLRSRLSCKESPDHGLDESSWKEGFHLVLPDSQSQGSNKYSASMDVQTKEKQPNVGISTISKEKYDDIARWIIGGKTMPESSSDSVNVSASSVKKSETSLLVGDIMVTGSPQLGRVPAARRVCVSSDSEDDDNFLALIESVRKKRIENQDKINVQDNSFIDDSFCKDDCRSDVVESPSFNIYHSVLSKSIKAEVKSIKKTVQSIKKKHVFRNLYDSDEFSEDSEATSPINKPKAGLKCSRKVREYPNDSEDSDTDFEIPTKGRNTSGKKEPDALIKHTHCSDDSEPGFGGSSSGHRMGNLMPKVSGVSKSHSGSSGCNDSFHSNDSDFKGPLKSEVSDWRKIVSPPCSSSESSCSTSSKSDLPKIQSKKKHVKKPVKTSTVAASILTPRNIAALKSPGRPYSPIRTFLSSLSGPTHEPGVRDHPEASVYYKNFKAKKEELTRRLFKLFNREVFDKRLPDDMLLEWNARLVRTAGLCYCKLIRKNGVTTRTSKIALSTKVITSPDRLRDTLIHEMCHAAVWLLNNVSGGHGPFWKSWAHKAMKRFPELPSIERCHTYNIETKFTYKCTKCGYSFGRHSKSLDLEKKRCGYCYGRFEVFLSSEVQGHNSQEKVMKTPRAPNAFALFVKENYGIVKQGNAHMKHGDIMKKLSENFASMKVKG